jgi:hypothetical protein
MHTLSRPTAAMVVLTLLAAAPTVGQAQGLRDPGDVSWAGGDFRRAAIQYVEEVHAGRGGDTAWFNAGTAGLAIGDTALANNGLGRAAESLDPTIRFRALYNLGLSYLRLAMRDTASRDRLLSEARRRYREALLLRPGDAASKRNLELAIRESPPHGGGGAQNPNPQGGGAQPPEPPKPRGGVSPTQAEQILNSVAEEERRAREDQRKRLRAAHETTGTKDW